MDSGLTDGFMDRCKFWLELFLCCVGLACWLKCHQRNDPDLASTSFSLQTPPHAAPASYLVQLLIERWAFGLDVSAPLIQKICSAAVADGIEHAEVIALSKIGTSGRHEHNCDRELRTIMGENEIQKQCLNNVQLPMKTKDGTQNLLWQTMLFPHALFSVLFNCFPDSF